MTRLLTKNELKNIDTRKLYKMIDTVCYSENGELRLDIFVDRLINDEFDFLKLVIDDEVFEVKK